MAHDWHFYTREHPAGKTSRLSTEEERRQGAKLKITESLTRTVWIAETHLDNGARFEAGPSLSREALNEEIAGCETRWALASNAEYSFKNDDGSATTAARIVSGNARPDTNPSQEECARRARVREERRVDFDLGLSGRPSFASTTQEVDVITPPRGA